MREGSEQLQQAVGDRYRLVESARLGHRSVVFAALAPDGRRVSIRRVVGDRTTIDAVATQVREIATRGHAAFLPLREAFFVDEPEPALILAHELPAGRTLAAQMEEGVVVREGEIVRVATFALETLTLMHGHHPAVAHGDLGLGTIFRGDDGRLALLSVSGDRSASVIGDLDDLAGALRALVQKQPLSPAFAAWLDRLPTLGSALGALLELRRAVGTGEAKRSNAFPVAVIVAVTAALFSGVIGGVGLYLMTKRHAALAYVAPSPPVSRLPPRMYGSANLLAYEWTYQANDDYIYALSLSPDGKRLATGSISKVSIWDTTTHDLVRTIAETGKVKCLAYSHDGRELVAGDENALIFTNVASGEEVRRFPNAHRLVSGCAWSRDDKVLYSIGEDGDLKAWNIATKAPMFTTAGTKKLLSIDVSAKGHVAIGSCDGTVRVVDATGRQLWAEKAHASCVGAVAFSPDGARLATAGDDHNVKGFDVASNGQLTEKYRVDHYDEAWGVAFSPDGTKLVTTSRDGYVRVVSAKEGDPITSEKTAQYAYLARIMPDGRSMFVTDRHYVMRYRYARRGLVTEVPRPSTDAPAKAITKTAEQSAFYQTMELILAESVPTNAALPAKLDAMTTAYPKSPLPLVARAQYTLNLGWNGQTYAERAATDARALLDDAAKRGPKTVEWYATSAWVSYAEKDLAGAREAIGAARVLSPDDPWARLAAVRMELDDKGFVQATYMLDEMFETTRRPEIVAREYRFLAEAYEGIGDLDAAEHAHEERIARNPNDAFAHASLASFYLYHAGDAERAIAEANLAMAQADRPEFRNLLATAIAERGAERLWDGHDAMALADFEASLKVQPTARAYYGRAAYQRGQAIDARSRGMLATVRLDLQKCEALAPGNVMNKRALADLPAVEASISKH